MPLQYAIEELILRPHHRPHRPADRVATRWNSDPKYHPVPQAVAETDEKHGVFSLVTHQGEKVSDWIYCNGRQAEAVAKALRNAKSSAAPHQDILGETLAVGDYVAMSPTETADLQIGKVVAFTEKKVRILSYGYYDVILKNASGLIKIQPSVLSD